VPCGIADHGVTSLRALTGATPSVEELARESVACFAEVFGAEVVMGDGAIAAAG
jgi:lipoate-protein ligase B